VETEVAMSGVDTKTLITSYAENILLKIKIEYLILIVRFIYVPVRRCSTS